MRRQRLQSTACKVAWYPGSAEKYAAFKAKFPQATELGSKVEGATNDEGYFGWTFAEDLSPAQVAISPRTLSAVCISKDQADFGQSAGRGTLSVSLYAVQILSPSSNCRQM